MAKLANITLNNSVPEATTFEVVKQVGTESGLREQNTLVPVSERDTVSFTFRPEKGAVPVKASARIVCPPSAAEKLADDTVDDVTVFIHVVRKENASPVRIHNALAYAKDLMADTIFVDMVANAAQPH